MYIGNTPTTQAFTPAIDYFSGNGATVAFTLSRQVASVAQVQAVIENVPQSPGTAFTVSGNVITFTSAPPSGTNNIYVYYTSPITQVIAPGQGTVGTAALAPNIALSGQSLTVAGNNISATNSLGFRNRIINGDMRIDQRNNGASVTAVNGTYTLDRWVPALTGGGGFSVQRSTTVPTGAGFTNSLFLTVTTADSSLASGDYYGIQQFIEGFNVADFAYGTSSAVPVTISFWARSSITGTYCVWAGNTNASKSYVGTYTINSANTWEQKTITVSGDTASALATDNSIGLRLWFTLGGGSSFTTTAGSWQSGTYFQTSAQTQWISTNGATFYITGVQLEAGSVATPFERRDYGRELIMCQRYYQKFTAPRLRGVSNGTTNLNRMGMTLPVTMRAAPTATSSGAHDWYDGTGIGTSTTVAAAYATADSVEFDMTAATGTTAGSRPIVFYISGSGGTISATAEL